MLKNIYPLLEKDQQKASLNGSGGVISPEIMLLATLRFLAGGMKWDICLSLDIGFGSSWGERGVIWPTLHALDTLDEYEIGLPLSDKEEMRPVSAPLSASCQCSASL